MRNKYALHLPFITHSELGNLTCLKTARAARFSVCAVVGDLDVLGEPREVFRGGFTGALLGPAQAQRPIRLVEKNLKHA